MMPSLDGQLERLFKEIPGLYRLRVLRIAEAHDRMIAQRQLELTKAQQMRRETLHRLLCQAWQNI